MLKKLELEAVRSDLATVRKLIARRSLDVDPAGYLQFSRREKMLEEQLAAIEDQDTDKAGVALFFGGRPTIGSRGIVADFGAKALASFQELVSTRYAALNGPVGSRGPVRFRDHSQLLLTDAVRGSFGFVLEEVEPEQISSEDHQLKNVVQEVVDLIYHTAEPTREEFEDSLSSVDDRVLGSMRNFMRLVDDAGATLRIVEGEREIALRREDVERARSLVDNMSIEVSERDARGHLYIMPSTCKFELHENGKILKGAVTSQCMRSITVAGEIKPDVLGKLVVVRLEARKIEVVGQETRHTYKLLRVYADDDAPNLFGLPLLPGPTSLT